MLARALLHAGQFDQAAAVCARGALRHVDGDDLHSLLFQIAYARRVRAPRCSSTRSSIIPAQTSSVRIIPWTGSALLALEHDIPASRAAYRQFLTDWNDADPDVPVLLQAKAECAALSRLRFIGMTGAAVEELDVVGLPSLLPGRAFTRPGRATPRSSGAARPDPAWACARNRRPSP